jgi:hypothetical protein
MAFAQAVRRHGGRAVGFAVLGILSALPLYRLTAQTQPSYATDSTAVVDVVKTVLHAMRIGDTAAMRARFHPSMPMRVTAWRNGAPVVAVDSGAAWVADVGGVRVDQLDERIGTPVVQVDGNLAQVWAYYEFLRAGEFSHCGADQFVLGRTEAGWKILSTMYSVRREGCSKDLTFTPRERALLDVTAAERAFAHFADTANIPAAFVWALRDDAIYLDGEGVKQMKPLYAGRRPGPSWLRWAPSWVDASADGTMGLTTGPFAWHPARDSAAVRRGNFMTIWTRGPERWQVTLDLGVAGDTTARLDEPLREQPAGVGGRAALTQLSDLDKRISGNGWLRTLRGLATPDVRVLRDGLARAEGREGLTGASSVRFTPLGGRVAQSGDIGATWGTWKDGNKRGAYVRFWRRTAEGWRVTVDRMGE